MNEAPRSAQTPIAREDRSITGEQCSRRALVGARSHTRYADGTMEPKVVVITGASGGIGAALARHLGKSGHHVVGAARGDEALRAVMREAASDAHAVIADMTQRLDVERVRDEAIRTFGHVDVKVSLVMPGMVSTDFGKNALGGSPPPPPGVPVQTPEEVVAEIVKLLESQAAEVYTTPALAAAARKYYEDVGAFEASMPPFGKPREGGR